MATGTGKTIVMAMLIAWQVLNKVTYPQDTRFSKNVFIVAPGLTVKSRLQVLRPSAQGNYYDDFNIVPSGLSEKLNQGKVMIQNWHALNWETEEKMAKKRALTNAAPKAMKRIMPGAYRLKK
jgi:type III restriction enzyme